MLLTAVVLLGLLVYFRPGMKHESVGAPLVADLDKVHQIRIALAGQLEVDLQKDAATWDMRAPLQWPADAALVQDFLDALAEPASNSFPATGADLGKFGLDRPLARFWLDGTEYDFGALQPISKQRYLQSGGRIYVVDGYLFARIAHAPYSWLDHHLFPEAARITALQLPGATLTQDAKGGWQIAPADKYLNPAALERFVQAWQAATARDVAPFAQAKSDGEVAVVLAGVKEPLRFEILEDPDFLVLARPDLGFEYQMDIGQLGILLSPAPAAATP